MSGNEWFVLLVFFTSGAGVGGLIVLAIFKPMLRKLNDLHNDCMTEQNRENKRLRAEVKAQSVSPTGSRSILGLDTPPEKIGCPYCGSTTCGFKSPKCDEAIEDHHRARCAGMPPSGRKA